MIIMVRLLLGDKTQRVKTYRIAIRYDLSLCVSSPNDVKTEQSHTISRFTFVSDSETSHRRVTHQLHHFQVDRTAVQGEGIYRRMYLNDGCIWI